MSHAENEAQERDPFNERNIVESTANVGEQASEMTTLLSRAPEPTDHDAVRKFIHELAEAGCSVMFILPGSKLPADMRSPQRRTADDKAAQQAARLAERRDWARVKSPAGLALATSDVDTLDGYLDKYVTVFASRYPDGVPVNLAIETGASRLVVIDCDTADQMQRWYDVADDIAPGTPPTVRSPGQIGPDGVTRVHDDGGHFWFTVPDGVDLPANPGAMTWGGDDGFAVLWNRRYALIPPSVRDEGPYIASGEVRILPDWLAEAMADAGRLRAERAERSRTALTGGGDAVQQWGAGTNWTDILAPTGWLPSGKTDGCGCETWTAPGTHASAKSATAHEPGCSRMDSPDPHLQVWTDHDAEPFEHWRRGGEASFPVSRLQAITSIHYDNDLGAAMTDLSDAYDTLAVDPAGVTFLDTYRKTDGASEADRNVSTVGGGRSLHITWACEIEPEPVDWLWVDISMRNTARLLPEGVEAVNPIVVDDIACVAPGHTWSAPEVETDGRIACGMVSIAAGREGSGKSSFGIWLASKITRGTLPGKHYGAPKRVFYLATEDSWKHTLVPRLMAAGADLSMVARIEVSVNESATVTLSLPEDVDLLTQSITDHGVALVVIDPLMSTMSAGLDTNGTRDVRTALEPLAAMADKTGAAVVALAHFNKATGLDALTRITGSGAFKDVARAVMVFAVGDEGERVFSQPKNSVGRNDLPSLRYEVAGAVVETAKGKAATARFAFTGIADSTVDDSLGNEHRRGASSRSGASPVEQFIAEYIAVHADSETDDGGVPAAAVIAAGAEAGYSEKQIKDARLRSTDPVITTQRIGFGQGSHMVWKVARKPGK